MSSKPSFPVGVNIIVIRDDKILLGKRKNVYGDGLWGMPGGHLEFSEGMAEAAKRELLEETGLTAEAFSYVNLFNDKLDNSRHYLHVSFLAKGVKGEPVLKEPDRCYEWQWFKLSDLPEDLFLPHKPNIEGFIKGVNFSE